MLLAELKQFAPGAKASILAGIVQHWDVVEAAGINTPARICHFMAQIAHESAGFRTTVEYADGSAYDTGSLAKRLGNTPEADGDGQRNKGRGLIQVTGGYNIGEFSDWCRTRYPDAPDFRRHPEKLAAFPWALISAVWYWQKHGLNRYADRNDIRTITKRINGGFNGLADRRAKFRKAVEIWGAGEVDPAGKPFAQSNTVKAALGGGAGLGFASIGDYAYQASMAVDTGRTLSESLGVSMFTLVVAGVAAAAIGYIVYDRWFIRKYEGL